MKRFLPLLALAAFVGCDEPTSADLPAVDIGGSYVLARAAGAPLEGTCFGLNDPAQGEMMSLGLMAFDTARSVVRQQEVRLAGFGCHGQNGGDTIVVEQERAYRVEGPRVIVERPSAGGQPVADTGTVVGNTLILRRNGHDFVYERAWIGVNSFYFGASDVDQWTAGIAWHTTASSEPSGWTTSFLPTHLARNQRLYITRTSGRPAPGTYEMGPRPSAPVYAIVARDLPGGGQLFETVSGTLVVTASEPDRVEGSFVADLEDGGGNPTRIQGSFLSMCAEDYDCL